MTQKEKIVYEFLCIGLKVDLEYRHSHCKEFRAKKRERIKDKITFLRDYKEALDHAKSKLLWRKFAKVVR